jgi:hypothetical protein
VGEKYRRTYTKRDVIDFIWEHFPFWPTGVQEGDGVSDWQRDYVEVWALFGAWCDQRWIEVPAMNSSKFGRLLAEVGMVRRRREGAWRYSAQNAYRQTGILSVRHFIEGTERSLSGYEEYLSWAIGAGCVPAERYVWELEVCDLSTREFDMLHEATTRFMVQGAPFTPRGEDEDNPTAGGWSKN